MDRYNWKLEERRRETGDIEFQKEEEKSHACNAKNWRVLWGVWGPLNKNELYIETHVEKLIINCLKTPKYNKL